MCLYLANAIFKTHPHNLLFIIAHIEVWISIFKTFASEPRGGKIDNILSITCQAALGLQEKHVEAGGASAVIQGLPTHLLGPVPLSVAMETKVSSSHQALLQHLLQKEQLRHQKILSTGENIHKILTEYFRTLYSCSIEYNSYILFQRLSHGNVKLMYSPPGETLSALISSTSLVAQDCPL